uniref:DNA-directed RNA polymerase n=1 Tax=Starmerella magnoliae TaxID=5490 RepID=A0A0P0J4U2_9ASCO|nr:RNA polymerase I largest subunit [Starmerella magnoliae]
MGHVGHIELPIPAYNPMFFGHMYLLLRSSCLFCSHFRLGGMEKHLAECQLRLVQHGLLLEARQIIDIVGPETDEDGDVEMRDIKVANGIATDRQGLEAYAYSLLNTLNEGRKRKPTDGDYDKLEVVISDTLTWVDTTPSATAEEYTAKYDAIKELAEPLLEKSTNKGLKGGAPNLATIKGARDAFVNRKIREAISSGFSTPRGILTPTVSEERRMILKELYRKLLSRPKCDNCGMYSPKYRKDGLSKIFETELSDKQKKHNQAKGMDRQAMMFSDKKTEPPAGVDEPDVPLMEVPRAKNQHGSRYVVSTEICNTLRAVFRNEQSLCNVMFNNRPSQNFVSADMFFAYQVVVPPTRFRLPSELGEEIHMNPMTELLQKVLQTCLQIKDVNQEIVRMHLEKVGGEERKLRFTQLMNYFVTLQNDYNGLLDATKNQNPNQSRNPLPGIKQALERKEGLFRKNMMGKRVNYAARSVISPDPNLETNEIGIPPVFALKLTYPEPVTQHNFEELRQAVINGPNKWPGATIIQNENGQQVSLSNMTLEQRTALANQLLTPSTTRASNIVGVNKKVFRHIRNRDVVLMNRQPTLHKASMMGHTVRVLPKEKTLRLHYANTGAYNADFDGDEMNMHFPQNEAARAEALLIANTNSQYLTPTSGKPLRGLIQDHISAGIWLTSKDAFYTREQYQQLIYGSVTPENGQFASDRVLLLPPAVLKPKALWTGKQVISTVLLNVCPANRAGINLTSSNKVKNEYWGEHSAENQVLFKDGQLLIGILDKSQYGAADHGLVHAIYEVYGADTAGLLLSVLGRLFTKFNMHHALTCGMDDLRLTEEGDQWRRDILQQAQQTGLQAALEVTNMPADATETNREFRRRLEEILRDDDKLGILDAVTQNKASSVTTQVVSTCIPAGTAKKFPRNSMQTMALSGAKGSNVNVSQIMCGLGQQALEGRRVPVMVSGKTLPSFKPYETHVRAGGYIAGRFYSGIRPQEYYFHCMAGREGLIDTAVKTSRSGYLQRCLVKQLEGVRVEYDNTVRDSDGTLVQFVYGGDAIDTTKESYLREFDFCSENIDALLEKHSPSELAELDDSKAPKYLKKARKHAAKDPNSTTYDPVVSVYNPARYVGSVSDVFESKLDASAEALYPGKDQKEARRRFKLLMQLKYQQSTVPPGDCVGVVAAQSIGEPSTQMTLNTFHFAGHGAANVTLGIPRMREIIMTASANIKTPQMILPIAEGVSDEQADVFCKAVTRIMLSQLVDKVEVTERMGFNSSDQYVRSYSVRINLYSRKEYEDEYDVKQHEVEHVLSNRCLSMLEDAVVKEVRRQKRVDQSVIVQSGAPATPVASTEQNLRRKPSGAVEGDEEASAGDDGAEGADSGASDVDSSDDDDEDVEAKKEAQSKGVYDEEEPTAYDNDDAPSASDSEDESGSDSNSDSAADTDDSDYSSEAASEDESAKVSKKRAQAFGAEPLSEAGVQRQNAVVGMHRTVRKFNFDDENGEWCQFELEYPASSKKLLMVNLIEELCRKVVVREVKNIDRCIRPAQHKDGRVMLTEGVNFGAMWNEHMFVDVDRIKSNDVAAVLHTYGVEAARQTIVNEISNVFQTYAIAVNQRHLDLIADMMTREGTFLPFSRQGLDSGTSPFLKMSFESTCQFLTKAVLDGASESIESPSARIVVGKPIMAGTGAFDLLTKA